MEKVKQNAMYIALFFFSFVVFLYWSFPYGVLKEALSSQIETATGIAVRMDHFGPAFPLGFVADGVEISGNSAAKIALKEVSLRWAPLQLFLGRLGVQADVEAGEKGELDIGIGIGILRLFSTKGMILPSSVKLNAKAFPLESLASYALKQAAASGVGGPVAGPLLGNLGFRGKLSGRVDLSPDSSALSQSSGDIRLSLNDAVIVLSNPSIGLPDQIFKMAQLNASMSAGALKVEPTTRFAAEELDVSMDGKVNVKNSLPASDLDLKVAVKITGELVEKFGWVMDGLTGGVSKGGAVTIQLRGTVGAPVTTTL